jgi:hypothetical protein
MIEIVAGWEPRQPEGYQICNFSIFRRTSEVPKIIPLKEKALRYISLYRRPHENRDGQLWDVISDAPMSTSFACSRFLLHWLATTQWILFCDFSDMLFLEDPVRLWKYADDRYAVMVVKRDHVPVETKKMDGQIQTTYHRKNWSSVILWNRYHPANDRLTLDMVNQLPGRDLHRFCWLEDHEIGELPRSWNFLVGVDQEDEVRPSLLHYTLGLPNLPGYEHGPLSHIWMRERDIYNSYNQPYDFGNIKCNAA